MKKLVFVFLISSPLFLIDALQAQVCNDYILTQEGTELEYTFYDKREKVTGKSVQKIEKVSEKGDGLEAEVNTAMYDKKDKKTFESDMVINCSSEGLHISMENYLSAESMSGFSEMDMDVEGDDLLIPADIKVGDVLPGGEMKLTISGPTSPRMTMTITIEDRKVEAREDITTPAGTFTCYKITYETETNMPMAEKSKSVEWFSLEAGQVKLENYGRNDKLTGYSVLSDLKK
ncbi:MAG: hypothetical protein ACOCXS_02580 [Bacteroidota bacterium]